ncbi:hypothetical protein M2410_002257 [Stenotrophomonas chelatiphaga]|uniref:hypothetical protein n=1 Tax=Stenotrophomonas chelatiphaga TaxID=517011 RepID=UPI000F4BBE00|nr:hypothetical protein [Stenotrophomonas chelatiphaga]MCS4231518.1 hypothetical protein [Stenotrophomonas chelatiphaga]
MSASYDSIVDQYMAYANASPTRPIEVRTMLQLAGTVKDRSVLTWPVDRATTVVSFFATVRAVPMAWTSRRA